MKVPEGDVEASLKRNRQDQVKQIIKKITAEEKRVYQALASGRLVDVEDILERRDSIDDMIQEDLD